MWCVGRFNVKTDSKNMYYVCIREGGRGWRRKGASDELIILWVYVRIQAIKQETNSVTGGCVEVGVCRLHSGL